MSVTLEDRERLKREVSEKIVAFYLRMDKNGRFLRSPQTDDELHEFIREAYGFNIPRKIITKGHKAPFNFVADLFFERVKNALGFASRNGGKTLSVAILNHLDMIFKQRCEVASAGAVLDQADKCYKYFQSFNELPWFKQFCEKYEKVTKKKFLDRSIRSYTAFGNGSVLEVITGTDKGLRSPHPHKARIDEIDLMEWSVLQTGLSMARSTPDIRGQNVFTSTRQKSQGAMQRLLDSAAQKGISLYEWNIWEAVEKCTRRCVDDPVHGSCPIYTYCKGRAHHCAGFYKIDDFIDKVRILDRETFETEWENLRPSKQKLVYWQFDNVKHVMTPQRLLEMFGVAYPRLTWYKVGGLDFGSSPGHPFVYLKFCQLPNNAWMLQHEYVAEQRLLRDHAMAIRSSPQYTAGEIIYADWDAQDRLELRSFGIGTRQAHKDVNMGCDWIGSLLSGFPPLEEPMLYFWYECPFTIAQMGRYSWPVKSDGSIDRSGVPKKGDDDAMDATRYALYSHKFGGTARYTARTIVGV